MSVLAWLIILYVVIDRLLTVGYIGHRFAVTKAVAVTSLITGAGLIYCVVRLAT